VPAGPNWLHEVKYDGYRMIIRKQDRVRLISRGGHDWAKQFPLIVEAALKLRQKHFVIDGEAVVLDKNGISDFDALHSRKHNGRAQLYAFDVLAGNERIIASCRSHCARSISPGCSRAAWAASSWPSASKATSATTYSAPHATWASRGSSRNAAIAPMAAANANIGSR
jgi:hypothetical protein